MYTSPSRYTVLPLMVTMFPVHGQPSACLDVHIFARLDTDTARRLQLHSKGHARHALGVDEHPVSVLILGARALVVQADAARQVSGGQVVKLDFSAGIPVVVQCRAEDGTLNDAAVDVDGGDGARLDVVPVDDGGAAALQIGECHHAGELNRPAGHDDAVHQQADGAAVLPLLTVSVMLFTVCVREDTSPSALVMPGGQALRCQLQGRDVPLRVLHPRHQAVGGLLQRTDVPLGRR